MEIFTYEGNKLPIIKKDDDVWFRAKTVASILGYSNSRKAINDHVDSEDRCTLNDLKNGGPNLGPSKLPPANAIFKHVDSEDRCTLNELKSKGNESLPLTGNLKNTI